MLEKDKAVRNYPHVLEGTFGSELVQDYLENNVLVTRLGKKY